MPATKPRRDPAATRAKILAAAKSLLIEGDGNLEMNSIQRTQFFILLATNRLINAIHPHFIYNKRARLLTFCEAVLRDHGIGYHVWN
jgi:hypothetical protein